MSCYKENLCPAVQPPQKKLALNRRQYELTLVNDQKQVLYRFSTEDHPQVFSQALSGRLRLRAIEAPDLSLLISWSHPDQPPAELRRKSKPYAERAERNDIRKIPRELLQRHYERHLPLIGADGDHGCLKAPGLQPDAGGYLRVQIQQQWFRYTHVILAYLRGENVYEAAERLGRSPPEVDCSHRCAHSWCCCVDHLVFETHETNMERVRCQTSGRKCPHSPRCLVKAENF